MLSSQQFPKIHRQPRENRKPPGRVILSSLSSPASRLDQRTGPESSRLAADAMRIDKCLYVGGNESSNSSNLDVRDLAIRRLVI